MLRNLLILLILCYPALSWAQSCFYTLCPKSLNTIFQPERDFIRQWDVMVYYGQTTKNTLGQVIGFNAEIDKERLYSFEIGRVNDSCGNANHWLGHFWGRTEFLLNFTYHDDRLGVGSIYEYIFYFRAHWTHFPWNHYVYTTFAIGEGVSYISDIPVREQRESDEPKNFLNYLMFEVSFAHPCHKEIELVLRIHHRSGVFGLYNANNSGATAVGLGLRYYFGHDMY